MLFRFTRKGVCGPQLQFGFVRDRELSGPVRATRQIDRVRFKSNLSGIFLEK